MATQIMKDVKIITETGPIYWHAYGCYFISNKQPQRRKP